MPTKKIPSPPVDPTPQSANAEYISALLKVAKDFTDNLEQIALSSITELEKRITDLENKVELTHLMVTQFNNLDAIRRAKSDERIAELENTVDLLTADVYQEGKTPQEFDMNEGLIVNITQVARTLGVSRATVYKMIETGTLPAKKFTTGSGMTPRTVVLADDLKAFLAGLPSAEGQPVS